MNSLRIAYSLGSLLSTNQILQLSKRADEKKNVDSLWIPESWGKEAFSCLGAISQITENVKLGTSIVNIYSRSPATVAMAAATLDELSRNRTVIGLGASSAAIVENWHGLKFEKPLSRMSDYIECLRSILTGQKVNYSGKFFHIKNFSIMHRPTRQFVPIFMGAVNERMVSLATDLADGVILYLRPFGELKKTVANIRSKIGNKKSFSISCVFIYALSNKDPESARRRAAKTLAFYTAVGKIYNSFLSNNGFRNDVERITYEYWKNGGDEAARYVPDNMLDSITICGNREECIKSLEKFLSTGISLPILQLNPIQNAQETIEDSLLPI